MTDPRRTGARRSGAAGIRGNGSRDGTRRPGRAGSRSPAAARGSRARGPSASPPSPSARRAACGRRPRETCAQVWVNGGFSVAFRLWRPSGRVCTLTAQLTAAKRPRSRPWLTSALRKRTRIAETHEGRAFRRRLGAGKTTDAAEGRLVVESLGEFDVRQIVPDRRRQGLVHRQPGPSGFPLRRKIERAEQNPDRLPVDQRRNLVERRRRPRRLREPGPCLSNRTMRHRSSPCENSIESIVYAAVHPNPRTDLMIWRLRRASLRGQRSRRRQSDADGRAIRASPRRFRRPSCGCRSR